MDDATALSQFERYLQRRFPERSTAKHYLPVDPEATFGNCPPGQAFAFII